MFCVVRVTHAASTLYIGKDGWTDCNYNVHLIFIALTHICHIHEHGQNKLVYRFYLFSYKDILKLIDLKGIEFAR